MQYIYIYIYKHICMCMYNIIMQYIYIYIYRERVAICSHQCPDCPFYHDIPPLVALLNWMTGRCGNVETLPYCVIFDVWG